MQLKWQECSALKCTLSAEYSDTEFSLKLYDASNYKLSCSKSILLKYITAM